MSLKGSPSTAMRSASMPGASAPIMPWRPSASALSDVAATMASMAPWPPTWTRWMISLALRPCAPATASVPMLIFSSLCRIAPLNLASFAAMCRGVGDLGGALVERQAGGGERGNGGQRPRAGQPPAGDGVAQRHVARSPDALHCREARHQHGIGVRSAVKRRFGRGLARGRGTAVLAEMRPDVNVRIDHAGEDGEPREIVRGGLRGAVTDLDDA